MKLPNDPLVLITFALAVGGNITWALLFFANSIKRKYAAERDFNHLKNNQKQISDNIAIGLKDQDERFDRIDSELKELKTYIIGKALLERDR